jgi:hypothetical protein
MKCLGIEIKNVWLYMWFIDKITSVTEEEIGWVLGKKEITYPEIQKELGISLRTYRRWIDLLKTGGYINVTRTPHGLSITVNKAFKRFNRKTDVPKVAQHLADVAHHKDKSGTSTSIQLTVNNNSKTITVADLKIKFFKHPLFEKYKIKYPDRDYDLAFEEMCAWYQSKKKRLPVLITAFGKWLSNTKVDEKLQIERRRALEKSEQDRRQTKLDNAPRASREKVEEFKQQMYSKIGRKI